MKNFKYFLIIWFLIINKSIYSQETIISGKIIDADTHQGIPYSSVVVFHENYGISCDEKGDFKLKISEKLKQSSLHFSSMGYKDSIVKIADIKSNTINIALTPNIYELKTVNIKYKKKKEVCIDKIHNSIINQYLMWANSPMVVGKIFYYNEKYKNYIIKKINIAFSRADDYDISPSFIIRMMELDSITNLPKRDFTKELLVKMDTCKIDGHYVFSKNIEDLKIKIPENGLFIGVQWICINENLINGKGYNYIPEGKTNAYAPVLKLKGGRSYNMNILTSNGGVWSKKNSIIDHADSEPYIEVILEN